MTGLVAKGPRVSTCPRAPSRSVTPLSVIHPRQNKRLGRRKPPHHSPPPQRLRRFVSAPSAPRSSRLRRSGLATQIVNPGATIAPRISIHPILPIVIRLDALSALLLRSIHRLFLVFMLCVCVCVFHCVFLLFLARTIKMMNE